MLNNPLFYEDQESMRTTESFALKKLKLQGKVFFCENCSSCTVLYSREVFIPLTFLGLILHYGI